jgi:tRNA A37 threonylcarbamoyladenosine dehydratase
MLENWHSRTELLVGKQAVENFTNKHIFIAGLGGVGGYVAEMLTRTGIGKLTIVDSDTVSQSNINRQIIALTNTVGKSKVELINNRLKNINPNIEIIKKDIYLNSENINEVLNEPYDYVVDAIDTLSPKISLIQTALSKNLRLISSMGAGAKLHPEKVFVTDIAKTYNDNLARILRKRLHRIGIRTGFKAVFSPEEVIKSAIQRIDSNIEENKRSILGSISYMPSVFGIHIAAEIINDFINEYSQNNSIQSN